MFKKILSVIIAVVFIMSLFPALRHNAFAKETSGNPLHVQRYTQEELREMYDRKYNEYFPDKNSSVLQEDYDQSIIDEINNNIPNNDLTLTDTELVTQNIQTDSEAMLQNPKITENEIMSGDENQTYNGYVPVPTGKVISKVYNANESVSLGSGDLNYTYNILSIPGRNGLDLDISLRYNSSDGIVHQSEFDVNSGEYTYHDHVKIAPGWSYVYPSVVNITAPFGEIGKLIRFSDGSSYDLSDFMNGTGSYKLNDPYLTIDSGEYMLVYSNGIKEYFDSYGTLVRRKDRFDNEIIFEYETRQGNGDKSIHVPNRIVDSVGNVVDIENEFVTYNGKTYISTITVSINDVVYSTINFDDFECGDISVATLKSIEDAEGNVTGFEYLDMPNTKKEVNRQKPNGRSVLLNKVTLPTGGVREYEYTKHIRAYNHLVYKENLNEWHEYYENHDVYKVSVIKDSNYTYRQYWYVGDCSGYPVSYPDTFAWEPEGYINDEEAKYHTIVYDMDLYTVYTFDYKHNLISECSYTDFRMLPHESYGTNEVIIGNHIYQIGQYQGTKSYADMYSMSYVTEPISDPPEVENEGSMVSVKTHDKYIYAFFASDDEYIAKEYNTSRDEWSVAGSTERLQSDGNNLTPKKFLYAGGIFYAVNGTGFLTYDPSKPVETRFERFSLPHSVDVLTSHGEYIYYH